MTIVTRLVAGAVTVCLFLFGCTQFASADDGSAKSARTRSGLQALYDFRLDSGTVVKDRSGVGEPVDLVITDPQAVRRANGSLEVISDTLIQSEKPPARIIEAVRWTGKFTLEAWIRPADTERSGPARIITFSKNGSERNVTLGQDKDKYDVRFRTTKTSGNGIPSLSTEEKTLTTELTHVVYTRNRAGKARVYINGKQVKEADVAGEPTNWDGTHRLALANELSGDRAWRGTYYLVAIYNRDLLPSEVEQHFKAGVELEAEPETVAQGVSTQDPHRFDDEIVPLLVNHCLECHDSSTKQGKLDLSSKVTAFVGGDSGGPIVPGMADKSLLWSVVESDFMPLGRTPLSDEEKQRLKEWIDEGAVWTTIEIDPAVHAHGGGSDGNWLQRLTVAEYIETVHSAVGVDIENEARELLPPDLRADGFSNTAYNLNVDYKHVEAFTQLAHIITGKMDIPTFISQFGKKQSISTDEGMREFIAAMGKWLLRGPLSEDEVTLYGGIATTVASSGGDFDEAARYIIEAMLQSPRFIYRVENQRGDGTLWHVGNYELASRLSYILWGAPPDKKLMKAADDGKLSDPNAVAEQVARMLEDPRAVKRSLQFISEWLDLDKLENLRPNSGKFPDWRAELAADMRQETLAFFEEVAWKQDRPLADLLNAQVTYVTPRLARHYGLELDSEGTGGGLSRYDLSSVPSRGGLLTQGSVLTVGGDEASMVTRGLFVLHDVLRGSVKDPPPCVDTTPVATKPGLTQRVIAEQRIANPSCGGCHAKFEPLSFGLEIFDGLGTYHEADEHGNALRQDGEIVIPGIDQPMTYESAAELMDLLAESERVRETITWKVAQFALGRPLTQDDAPILEEVHKTAQQNGGTYPALITAIVMSDLVQKTRTEAYQ